MLKSKSMSLRSGKKLLWAKEWGFDEVFYLRSNPDVAISGASPRHHYSEYGWKEGRDPSDYFSTSGYLASNPDVAAAGVNPLEHFIKYGASQRRTGWKKRCQSELHAELRDEIQALKDELVKRPHFPSSDQDSRSALDASAHASISVRPSNLLLTPRAKTLFYRIRDIAMKQ